jgi:hypothetical protein
MSNRPVHLDAADPDWIKRGRLDLPEVDSPADLRELLWELEITVEAFKRSEVYRENVEGHPWLKDL